MLLPDFVLFVYQLGVVVGARGFVHNQNEKEVKDLRRDHLRVLQTLTLDNLPGLQLLLPVHSHHLLRAPVHRRVALLLQLIHVRSEQALRHKDLIDNAHVASQEHRHRQLHQLQKLVADVYFQQFRECRERVQTDEGAVEGGTDRTEDIE